MIADTVLIHHEQSLKIFVLRLGQLHSLALRCAIDAMPGAVSSTFLGGLGLLREWGEVNKEKMERFGTIDFKELGRREKHGMLFFILLVESRLFSRARGTFTYNHTAQDGIKAFRETRAEVVWRGFTTFWLMQYCEPANRLF